MGVGDDYLRGKSSAAGSGSVNARMLSAALTAGAAGRSRQASPPVALAQANQGVEQYLSSRRAEASSDSDREKNAPVVGRARAKSLRKEKGPVDCPRQTT